MALVKILVENLFAGASFQKLEAGKVYDVDDAVAENWIAAGKAEATKEKGETLLFEVATPSTPRLLKPPCYRSNSTMLLRWSNS